MDERVYVNPNELRIHSGNNPPVLIIKKDGSIEIGEGYTPTEAGEAFIGALEKMHIKVTRGKKDE